MKREPDLKDILVDKNFNGSFFIETFIKPNNKVYYRVGVGYKNYEGSWVNRYIIVLDRDISDFMALLRLAILTPKKSYYKLIRSADLSAGGDV